MIKIIYAYLVAIALLTAIISGCAVYFCIDVSAIYKSRIGGTLFTAFLTMGSLMLSLVSMFMFSLKEKLFDNDDYKKMYFAKKNILNIIEHRYSPLVNISRLFLFCVMMCFITSLAQFTIGLIECTYFIAFCLSLAFSTILLALYVLYNVWINFEVWFKLLQKNE